jgi:DNA-binding NarL/FixJ family response regulator
MQMAVTPAERLVADCLLDGCSNYEIGHQLGISHRTVKQHLRRLFMKYGIRDGVKRIKLAVTLYYERNPEKRIHFPN